MHNRPKLLVTGANGFVGAALVGHARSQGWNVLELIRRGRSPGSGGRLSVDSMLDIAAMTSLVESEQPDCVVHCVGSASVHGSKSYPIEDHQANTQTFHVLLEGIRRAQIRTKVLLISSAAVYGNPQCLPVSECADIAPISPYGFHKRAAELFVEEYGKCFRLEAATLRVFSLLGPAQRRLLIYEIARQALDGEVVRLRGTGSETRDFLYIDDLSPAILGLLTAEELPSASPINVASGIETSVQQVVDGVARLLGKDLRVEYQGVVRPEEPRRWRADIRRVQALLPDWQPRALDAALDSCLRVWSRDVVR